MLISMPHLWLAMLANLGLSPELAVQAPPADVAAPTLQRAAAPPTAASPETTAPAPAPVTSEPGPTTPDSPPTAAAPEPSPTAAQAEPEPTDAAAPETAEADANGSDATDSETAQADATEADATDSDDPRPARAYPRLVLAAGPMLGPHAIGNEECSSELVRCETKGSFFGLGGQIDVRARLWRPIYLNVRGVLVSNVSPNERIYRGLGALAVGLGAYGRRVFGRAEYLYVNAFGDNRFEPPFSDGNVASDEWGNHAGMLSVGFRQPLPKNLSAELWGGVVFGPTSVRQFPEQEPDERVLTTFMLGLNLAWDAWQ